MWYQIEDVRHPAELGKGTSLHLPHQVGAMHLHRRFGDADIVGNLLVQATRHDMEHDLSLAGTERVETLSEPSQSLITLPSGSVARESRLDSLNKVLVTERFCQELHGTALHCLDGHRHVGVRCDEDDRHLPLCRSKIALKLEAASPRHSHVEYQAGWAVRRIGLQEIGNRRKFAGMQADRPQQPRDRVAKLGIVIDDQHAWSLVKHPESSTKGSGFRSFYAQSGDMNSACCLGG